MPDPPPAGEAALVLYVTRGCHLCDEAAALLRATRQPWQALEIGYDDGLVARYGVHIPVLRRADNGAELEWPFDATALAFFLRAEL